MTRTPLRLGLWLMLAAAWGCASFSRPPRVAPMFPDYAKPVVPAALVVAPDVRDRTLTAWIRLQSGDVRGAVRDYNEVLRRSPRFYPAETGLGLTALADRQFKTAAAWFRTALGRDERYVPAWRGLVEAELGAGRDEEAIAALERLLALDASREADRTRLELLRVRQTQTLLEAGGRAREAGRLDEAAGLLTRALALSPRSTAVLEALVQVEILRGQLDEAEAHARRAVVADATDASAHGALASVFAARGRQADAAAALARAAALDPAWRDRAAAARARADEAAAPAEMRDLASRATVTRGQLAALIAARLRALVAQAPRRMPAVATDVRGYWAETSIVAVTQAGIMDVLANHTFEPMTVVRRADLARTVAALVALALAAKPDQLSRWQGARPAFADLATSSLFYRPAALAVTAGAMTAGGGRFEPTRAASGADVLAAIARIEELAGR